jgi:hypothetical protein
MNYYFSGIFFSRNLLKMQVLSWFRTGGVTVGEDAGGAGQALCFLCQEQRPLRPQQGHALRAQQ